MSKAKAPDEMFCRSCGETIKRRAEICPNCGVANEQTETEGRSVRSNNGSQTQLQQTAPQSAPSSSKHDPSEYTTTVSDKWQYGVAASIAVWVVGLVMPDGSGVAGLLILAAWALMPLSIYYDRRWVRATTEWNPKMNPWIILSVVPVINLVGGAVYLFRRYSAPEISSPRTGQARSEQTENDPLENLQERYARGELSDEEFEQKVEQVLGTEDRETARMQLNRDDKK